MEKRCGTCRHFSQNKICSTVDIDLGHCLWPLPENLPAHFAEYCRKPGTPVVWKTDGINCETWEVKP